MRSSVATLVALPGLVVLISGCAGVSPVQVGQMVGTIAGSAVLPGAGGPVGSLVGLLAGMVVQGEVDKSTEKRERKDLNQQLADDTVSSEQAAPPLGEPTRVWVDETVQNGRVIPGHFESRVLSLAGS